MNRRQGTPFSKSPEPMLILIIAGLIILIAALVLIPSVPELSNIFAQRPEETPDLPSVRPRRTPLAALFQRTPTVYPTPTAFVPRFNPDDPWINERIRSMTTAEKIGQMLMIGIDGMEATTDTCGLIQSLTPGGIYLRPSNMSDPSGLRKLAEGLHGCAQEVQDTPPFIALDYEGQDARRFYPGLEDFPGPLAIGATGNPQFAYRAARAAGYELAFSGVNMVFGPGGDVRNTLDSKLLGARAFGGDPETVGQFVTQAIKGYSDAGLISVLMNFPGEGNIREGKRAQPDIDATSLTSLEAINLPPYRAGVAAGAPAVMLSNITYPNISKSYNSAGVSPQAIQMLESLPFDGIVISGVSNAKIDKDQPLDPETAALVAAKAGADLLVVSDPNIARQVHHRLVVAAGTGELPADHIDSAVRRILAVKAAYEIKNFAAPSVPEPNWEEDIALSKAINLQAITVLRDKKGWVPLAADKPKVLIIAPDRNWDFYPLIQAALYRAGFSPRFEFYSPPYYAEAQSGLSLRSLTAEAEYYDQVVIFTWNAHIDKIFFFEPWQSRLVNALSRSKKPVVVVALRSPSDLVEFAGIGTYITTYGTGQAVMDGLVEVLLGQRQAQGINPLPNLLSP